MKNEDLIKALGIEDLSKDSQDKILLRVFKTVDIKVGIVLAKNLSDDKLVEFQNIVDKSDQAATETWLAANYPDYKELVEAELEAAISDIKQMSEAVIAKTKTKLG